MKLDYCQTHRGAPVEDAALPCLAIRHDDGRRVTQRELWAEIERLRAALRKANDQAEHFERLWYLTNEDAGRYAFAKTLEGQVVTMETFKSRGAEALDQALDDAMMEAADAQNETDDGANARVQPPTEAQP